MEQAGARGRRVDIQLLRALAVAGVVVNHLFPQTLTGGYLGVDIFFVISGFLITSHLTGEAVRSGTIRLGRFWARRARRLLPASLLVLLASTVATVVWLPQSRWSQVMDEVLASALYVQNWQLAASAQDYFRSSQAPSPVTHYWSLSVEEQFYLVWPLLALLVWRLTRRRTEGQRRAFLALAIAAVATASLVFAWVSLASDASGSYFATPGRAWEFGAGALLGCLARLPGIPRGAALLGWVAMATSMVLFDETSAVPGPVTLVPVLGCVLVIWAGSGTEGARVPALLRVPVWVGDISYSIYLWHWPLIVFTPYVLGRPLTPLTAVPLLLLTLLLAHLSTRFVEDPVRAMPRLAPTHRSLLTAGVAMALLVAVALYVPRTVAGDLTEVQRDVEALVRDGGQCVGAAAGTDGSCPDSHQLRVANADLVTISNSPYQPAWGTTCQVEPEDPEPAPCAFGVPARAAAHTIALVGDSHAGQWAAPLDVVAQRRDLHVQMHVKSSCQPATGDLRASWSGEAAVRSCRTWGKKVAAAVAEDPSIDVVVVSAISRSYVSDDPSSVTEQWRSTWRRWTDAGKRVLVVADVPELGLGDMPTCLGTASTVQDPCSAPAAEVHTPDPLVVAADGMDHVTVFDPAPHVCGPRRCHGVVGGLPVYGDANHLNSFFSRTYAPFLESALLATLGHGDRAQSR